MELLKYILIGKLIFFASVLAKWPKGCKITKGELCYILNGTKTTHDVAESSCQGTGGQLVSVTDNETAEFLVKRFPQTCRYDGYCRYWIKNIESSSFTNWQSGQPDYDSPRDRNINNRKFCVAANFETGKWSDDYCYQVYRYYICEYKMDPCSLEDLVIPNADFQYCNKKFSLPSGNSSINVNCHEHYHLIGPPNVTCVQGKWTALPECRPSCLRPTVTAFTSQFNSKDIYFFGEETAFFCDPGYIVENNPSRSHFTKKCGEKGRWSNENVKCIPIKNRNIKQVKMQQGEELVLECIVSINGTDKQVKEDWLWKFGSHRLDPSADAIDSEGNLHISKFSELGVGLYTCFLLHPTLQMGQISYNVVLDSRCEESSTNEITYVIENNSFLIDCPKTEAENVKWMKNGVPLIENSRIAIADDGSLVFYSVIFEDSTNYTCVITDRAFCSKTRNTEIRVIATAESICGKVSVAPDHPWTVSLWNEEEKSPFCYGTLIHEKYVVTSAYCISSFYRQRTIKIYVQFGKQLLDIKELLLHNSTSQQLIAVESIKIHPKYSRRLLANDIGLLRLKDRVEFSETIQPICISNKDFTIRSKCDKSPYLHGTVSGWGSLEMDNGDNGELHEESLTLLQKVICRNTDTLKFTDDMFCANSNDSFSPIFAADIGSSFEYIDNEKVYLLGIYSLGERSTYVGDYDYFTKLASYVPWIRSIIKN